MNTWSRVNKVVLTKFYINRQKKDSDAVSTLRAKNTISAGPAEHTKATLWLLLKCVTLHGVYLFQTTNCLEYSTEKCSNHIHNKMFASNCCSLSYLLEETVFTSKADSYTDTNVFCLFRQSAFMKSKTLGYPVKNKKNETLS